MFNPIKVYRKSQEIQWNWIRSHPVQYVALNATLLAVFIGYTEYKDRKDLREIQERANEELQKVDETLNKVGAL